MLYSVSSLHQHGVNDCQVSFIILVGVCISLCQCSEYGFFTKILYMGTHKTVLDLGKLSPAL